MVGAIEQLTAEIVMAYAGRNDASLEEIISTFKEVRSTLSETVNQINEVLKNKNANSAALPRISITRDAIVCLECGKRQKMLKRHLAVKHGTTPDSYRAKWKLPQEYPMTAPSCSAARSEMAKAVGLGRKPGQKRGAKK